jgi:hypothetical protein
VCVDVTLFSLQKKKSGKKWKTRARKMKDRGSNSGNEERRVRKRGKVGHRKYRRTSTGWNTNLIFMRMPQFPLLLR